jgi:hypothetical protein
MSANIIAGNRPDQSRYRFENGRWWYWTPQQTWLFYENGQWMNYGPPAPYITSYGGSQVMPSTAYSYPVYSSYYLPDYSDGVYVYPGYWYGWRPWGWYARRGWWW